MSDQSSLEQYGMILQAWSAQVDSYWQRNSYFAAFETAALGGTWFVFSGEGGNDHFMGWWFWFLGIVLTVFWVYNNLKNHAYLTYWWKSLEEIERTGGVPSQKYASEYNSRRRGFQLFKGLEWPEYNWFTNWGIPMLFAAGWLGLALKFEPAWSHVLQVFSALLTPIIAVVTVCILWQQKNIADQRQKTNRNQFRLALLEKRLNVFNGAGELVATVLRTGKVDSDALQKFLWETREKAFLFGTDITAYLDEVYKRASDVYTYDNHDNPQTPDQIEERKKSVLWFSGQYDELKKQFMKYMAFREPD